MRHIRPLLPAAGLQEPFHRRGARCQQRSETLTSFCKHISASANEQHGHLGLITIRRTPERSVAETVSRLDGRAAVQQSLGEFYVTPAGRHVQRRAVFHAIVGVYVRTRLHQSPHQFAATFDLALVAKAIERSVTTRIRDVGPGASYPEETVQTNVVTIDQAKRVARDLLSPPAPVESELRVLRRSVHFNVQKRPRAPLRKQRINRP